MEAKNPDLDLYSQSVCLPLIPQILPAAYMLHVLHCLCINYFPGGSPNGPLTSKTRGGGSLPLSNFGSFDMLPSGRYFVTVAMLKIVREKIPLAGIRFRLYLLRPTVFVPPYTQKSPRPFREVR